MQPRPHIPVKEVLQIEKQSTEAEKQAALEAKEKAKKWLEQHKWKQMSHFEAHQLLDKVKEGVPSLHLINKALELTGDLE